MRGHDGDAWADWQRRLAAAISADAAAEDAAALLPWLAGDTALQARRLARWRSGRAAHGEHVLAQVYPAVRRTVGETAFAALARAYLLHAPSRDPDIGALGDRMPRFLARHPAALPWRALARLAHLERVVRRQHDAANVAALTAAQVAPMQTETLGELHVRLHPACRLHRTRADALACWEAASDQHVANPAGHAEKRDVWALIFRRDWRIAVRTVTPAERAALLALRRGCPLAQALAAADAVVPQGGDVGEIGAMFARWLADGVLVRAS